jgi:glycosyltransferase involved in cell wall biosynthesis
MSKSAKHTNKDIKKPHYPTVSICTPTFNRRPFFPFIIKCFENQDYPKEKLEWIIIDDGTDPIEDLVREIPQVKYFRFDKKMTLGRKRNMMHDKSSGQIIVYMDDDDYYPPDRVSHAVETLQKNPQALCAGSSEMYIYFKHIQKMVQFGPYTPNHATAATFAFRRELLRQTRYEETASVAEEKAFLKNYTIPFVQLDSMKCILVFSHVHNSFDKKTLLEQPSPYVNVSPKTPEEFVKEPEILQFFMNDIDELLEKYDPGRPEHKPDVLKQIAELKQQREEQMQQQQQQQQQIQIPHNQIQDILNNYEVKLREVLNENAKLKEQNEYLQKKITELIKMAVDKKKNKTDQADKTGQQDELHQRSS